jgi:hypothetical protein
MINQTTALSNTIQASFLRNSTTTRFVDIPLCHFHTHHPLIRLAIMSLRSLEITKSWKQDLILFHRVPTTLLIIHCTIHFSKSFTEQSLMILFRPGSRVFIVFLPPTIQSSNLRQDTGHMFNGLIMVLRQTLVNSLARTNFSKRTIAAQ